MMEQCKGSYLLFLVPVRKIHMGNLVREGKIYPEDLCQHILYSSLKAQIEYHIFQSQEPNICLKWDIQIFESYF